MSDSNPKSLHPATRLGYVYLTVSDLKQALVFYQDVVGLDLISRFGDNASLGSGEHEILRLTGITGARRWPGTTGLYHFAILVPDRAALGDALKRIVASRTQLGAADHLVSEALYISDPDGNGIEIYRDRPRSEWPYDKGHLQMAVDPLDLRSILADAGTNGEGDRLPKGTVLGHIHVHVSDLHAAEGFYIDILGFERMARLGEQASFVAAGGYHHHLGVNTWAGVGAPPPPSDAVGLRYFTIELPDLTELEKVSVRLKTSGYALQPQENGILLRDPSGNGLLLRVAG